MDRRFFCAEIPAVGELAMVEDGEAHHLRTVLRAQPGESVTLLDGRGAIATAELLADGLKARRGPLRCRITARRCEELPELRLALAVAAPKGKLMNQIVREATALGLACLQPLLTRHGISDPGDKHLLAWPDEAVAGCKQSGNPWLPNIAAPTTVAAALAGPLGGAPGCFGHRRDDRWQDAPSPPVETVRAAHLVCLWVGPEGGFAPDEIAALEAAGKTPLALGPYTLRVETAVIAGLARLQAEYN